MELTSAIMWSIVLMADMASALTGGAANWILVFSPLSVLILKSWQDYFDKR